jgi:hypothetical protein
MGSTRARHSGCSKSFLNKFTPELKTVATLSETVLVLEEKYWDLVDKRAKILGFKLPLKGD